VSTSSRLRGVAGRASVVEHHIELAEIVDGGSDESLDLRLVSHVGAHVTHGVTEALRDGLSRLVGDIGEHHLRPLPNELLDGGEADAAGTTRDDGDLVAEQLGHGFSFRCGRGRSLVQRLMKVRTNSTTWALTAAK
jgi:hypothetical protein